MYCNAHCHLLSIAWANMVDCECTTMTAAFLLITILLLQVSKSAQHPWSTGYEEKSSRHG